MVEVSDGTCPKSLQFGAVPKRLRGRSAKPLFGVSNTLGTSNFLGFPQRKSPKEPLIKDKPARLARGVTCRLRISCAYPGSVANE